MRISDWSSDVCSSDLLADDREHECGVERVAARHVEHGEQPLGQDDVARPQPPRCPERQVRILLLDRQIRDELAAARRIGVGREDRKSVVEGKSVAVRVYLGGRRTLKKKNQTTI